MTADGGVSRYLQDRLKARVPAPRIPRNIKAAESARAQKIPLFISFIGDLQRYFCLEWVEDRRWSNPMIYCDPGVRYDWSCVRGLCCVLVARPGVDIRDAAVEILGNVDVFREGYPVLIDFDSEEVACIVEGDPFNLWRIKRGSHLWQQYFAP